MSNNSAIILASRSPRRRDLLRQLGLRFVVIPPSGDEAAADDLAPAERVVRLALRKAAGVSQLFPERIVLAADTIVVLGDGILGKPASADSAREMLCKLAGRIHSVYSGVAVMRRKDCLQLSGAVQTKVKLRRLGRDDIEGYLRTGEPFGKAGAYAIQGRGIALVERIEGDYSNVVGLPLGLVSDLLLQAGLDVWAAGHK